MGVSNKKPIYEEVYDFYKAQGYLLLEDTYTNARTNMSYVCECGEISATTFSHFKNRGVRCLECAKKKKASIFRLSQEEVEKSFKEQGCKLLSTYTKHTNKVKYICSCGSHSTTTFNNFRKGHRCSRCGWDKRLSNMYKNGTAPSSSQQVYIHSLIGGKLNYPIDRCMLDIAFPDEMIYVEYDGGGHDLSVKLGIVTLREFNEKQKRRTAFLASVGWKCIRIISKYDYLPNDKVLIFYVNTAKDFLKSNDDIEIEIRCE